MFFSAALLSKAIGEDVSRWVFVLVITVFVLLKREKWWVYPVSFVIGFCVFILLLVLFIP